MTLISDDPPFVFVHVPKTGGSSVKTALARFATHDWVGADVDTKHLTVAEIDALRPAVEASGGWSFAVVRDPRDRIASLYEYVRSNPFHPLYVDVVGRDFESFVRGRANASKSSMCDYLVVHGALGVDQVIRYEELAANWSELLACLGISESISLPAVNVSIRDPATQWTPGLLEFVAEAWAQDFAMFGYDPSDLPRRATSA